MVLMFDGPQINKEYSPLNSNIKNIPPWSYPDAAAAGPAAAASAAASAVCIHYVIVGFETPAHITSQFV